MASSPPMKCLRGTIRITPDAAATLATKTDVPVAIGFYRSMIGFKPEIWYQRLNGDWIELTRAGAAPGIYEHPTAMIPSEAGAEAEIANQKGIVMWNADKLQQWANDNLYAFFKGMVSTPTGAPGNAKITGDTLIDVANASLADHFHLIDTNGDGLPEFHGK